MIEQVGSIHLELYELEFKWQSKLFTPEIIKPFNEYPQVRAPFWVVRHCHELI